MDNQFNGMTAEDFSYSEYETVREKLVDVVNSSLTAEDRNFLMSVKELTPDWGVYDFSNFPSVRWKLLNLEKLRGANSAKHGILASALRAKLWPNP